MDSNERSEAYLALADEWKDSAATTEELSVTWFWVSLIFGLISLIMPILGHPVFILFLVAGYGLFRVHQLSEKSAKLQRGLSEQYRSMALDYESDE